MVKFSIKPVPQLCVLVSAASEFHMVGRTLYTERWPAEHFWGMHEVCSLL
jgi:hypothetical protein